MALEMLSENVVRMQPGPFDVHMHPRVTDAITQELLNPLNDKTEGKAGIDLYLRAAMLAGFTGGNFMPNELGRLLEPDHVELTKLNPYPISNKDRVRTIEFAISQRAVIPAGLYLGLDPTELHSYTPSRKLDIDKLIRNFHETKEDVLGLKIFGGETFGGFNVNTESIPELIRVWHRSSVDKPVILHLEDEDVGKVLSAVERFANGKEIPIHIAHVSSRVELEAVLAAKAQGLNVTCEVTPHHLFLDDSVVDEIGGYGCMKPTLKKQEDIDFLWAHIDDIDIIASDCAPHRKVDKEGTTTYGVTNHTVMLPLLFGAVQDGKFSKDTDTDIQQAYDRLFDKLCVQPRKRFQIPEDNSFTIVDLSLPAAPSPTQYELLIRPGYGYNPFAKLNRKFNLVGQVVEVAAGVSHWHLANLRIDESKIKPSYTHLLRPATMAMMQTIQKDFWQHEQLYQYQNN